jgi:hypothetical protein
MGVQADLPGRVKRRFSYEFGAGPLHAIGLVASFALTGYAVLQLAGEGGSLSILLWFLDATVAHDIGLFPLCALADRLGGRIARPHKVAPTPPAINYLRVPALLSGLMLLVWFPLVLGLSGPTFQANTGLTTDGYLARWLLLTGALFPLSGLAYALRRGHAR